MLCELETGHVPFKGVLAFCPEEVNMGLELQLEDVLLVDAVGLFGGADGVAEQREAGQREIILQTRMEAISEQRASVTCFIMSHTHTGAD